MTEEQIVRHIHENKENRPDSLEIGTPKTGVIKVYVNLLTMNDADIRAIINKAQTALTYAKGGMSL
jgi:xanthine/CO dehydrogenase XdhC/CoxF family maturation factor